MVSAAEVLTLVELLGHFLFENGRHEDLAPLLATHSGLAVLRTLVQDHLDNTVRAVAHLGGAWVVQNTRVLFWVRTGRRAERTVRRGHRQPVDLCLLQALGYLPRAMYQAMGLRGTRVQLARASRTYLTTRGHVEVQEVEARVRFRGSHYVYWNLQCITSFQGGPPTDSSESWSLSESGSTEGFV